MCIDQKKLAKESIERNFKNGDEILRLYKKLQAKIRRTYEINTVKNRGYC